MESEYKTCTQTKLINSQPKHTNKSFFNTDYCYGKIIIIMTVLI